MMSIASKKPNISTVFVQIKKAPAASMALHGRDSLLSTKGQDILKSLQGAITYSHTIKDTYQKIKNIRKRLIQPPTPSLNNSCIGLRIGWELHSKVATKRLHRRSAMMTHGLMIKKFAHSGTAIFHTHATNSSLDMYFDIKQLKLALRRRFANTHSRLCTRCNNNSPRGEANLASSACNTPGIGDVV